MELYDLKSLWNNLETPVKTQEEIQKMLSENNHPVLKSIRRQFALEIAGWLLFLVCYYTMFDGDMKPFIINAILIVCTLLPIIHNLVGYRFAKYLQYGTTIQQSLMHYFAKVKNYVIVSIITRVVYASGLLLFFLYNVQFSTDKYLILSAILLFLGVQIYLLYLLWRRRLRQLKRALFNFH